MNDRHLILHDDVCHTCEGLVWCVRHPNGTWEWFHPGCWRLKTDIVCMMPRLLGTITALDMHAGEN